MRREAAYGLPLPVAAHLPTQIWPVVSQRPLPLSECGKPKRESTGNLGGLRGVLGHVVTHTVETFITVSITRITVSITRSLRSGCAPRA
jgi:hypothetical protein